MIGKQARLHRLFGGTGKCLDVAVDHGFFDEPSFLAGIEDLQVRAVGFSHLLGGQPHHAVVDRAVA